MSIKGRLTGHFLGRAFLLFLALGMVFIAWGVGVAVVLTKQRQPQPVAGTSPIQLLETVRDATTISRDGIVIAPETQRRVRNLDGWIQVLDPSGRVLYDVGAPSTVPTAYAPGEVVYFRNKPQAIGQGAFFTLYSEEKGRLTWVLGSEKDWKTPLQRAASPLTLVQAFAALIVLSVGVALLVAWVSSETLSRPLVHILGWLDGLARGSYAEPLDRHGRSASRLSDGTLRKPYRTYREVIGSLDTLTDVLGRNETERERIEAAREEWIAGITHDLRTPLSSVRGYADLLGSDHDFSAEESKQFAHKISDQAENMERLIDDFALSFRLRADALPLELARVDLVEVARDSAIAIANDPRAFGHDITFEGSASAGSLPVDIDARYISRALANMLVNAVLHNPEGTNVIVSAQRVGGWACVDVRDTGRGMDAATLDRLFDRYYRGTASGGDAHGTGLGMAIARQLVEAHGGTVEVSSAVGSGTAVRICLPLAD